MGGAVQPHSGVRARPGRGDSLGQGGQRGWEKQVSPKSIDNTQTGETPRLGFEVPQGSPRMQSPRTPPAAHPTSAPQVGAVALVLAVSPPLSRGRKWRFRNFCRETPR